MKRIGYLLLLWFFSPICANASVSNVYIGQSSAGSGDGSSCVNQKPITFFNTAANWGSGSTQIGPGTTVHVCGLINVAANTTALAFQGSGSSGNPVTLLFEPGAIVQAPYFPASVGGVNACGGGVCGQGKSFIVIDGGTNGIVQ